MFAVELHMEKEVYGVAEQVTVFLTLKHNEVWTSSWIQCSLNYKLSELLMVKMLLRTRGANVIGMPTTYK